MCLSFQTNPFCGCCWPHIQIVYLKNILKIDLNFCIHGAPLQEYDLMFNSLKLHSHITLLWRLTLWGYTLILRSLIFHSLTWQYSLISHCLMCYCVTLSSLMLKWILHSLVLLSVPKTPWIGTSTLWHINAKTVCFKQNPR